VSEPVIPTSTQMPPAAAATRTPAPPTATHTPTAIPTATQTPSPAPTGISAKYPTTPSSPMPTPTQTQTGTAQIPLSTFVPENAVTRTPAAPAVCPAEDPDLVPPDLEQYANEVLLTEAILTFLNAGGKFPIASVTLADLTDDGVDEVLLVTKAPSDSWIAGILFILGCDRGAYQVLTTIRTKYEYYPKIFAITDMNLDGVPELVIEQITCHYCTGVWVYEWDGQRFQSLVRHWEIFNNKLTYQDSAETTGRGQTEVKDTDGNGTIEVVLRTVPTSHPDAIEYGPWRSEIQTFMWDGQYFSLHSVRYSPPEYRFQAVQDGDRVSLDGDFDAALAFYQSAIFSDTLKSWSTAIGEQIIDQYRASWRGTPTPTPLPPDPIEYDQLAAYARYRIMILHLLEGQPESAQIVYDTLLQKFPLGNAGYPYAEMATLFWSEYQSSQDIGLACSSAVAYAAAHPEILAPLTGPEFSAWNRIYKPSDVCPFDNSNTKN